MKRFLTVLLALALAVSLCQGALASVGDLTIYHLNRGDSDGWRSVDFCMLCGEKIYYMLGDALCVYDLTAKTTETYSASDMLNSNTFVETDGEQQEGSETSYWRENAGWFCRGDQLYAVINLTSYAEDSRSIDAGYVYRLQLEDGVASLVESELPKLDWSPMIEDYGEYMYSRWAQNMFTSGDTLFAQTYDNDGNNIVVAFDLNSGRSKEHYIQDLYGMAATGDDRLFVELFNWAQPEKASFAFYNPADESLEMLGEMTVEDYNLPRNFCYDVAGDIFYYCMGGEIWAAPGFDFDQAYSVNDSPVDGSDSPAQMTADGYLLLYDWETIVLRCTDPALRSEITMYIKDYGYNDVIETAYYDYTNLHGDVSMVISRNGSPSDILQAMMNRDDSVDIYCMDMSLSQFSALFNRGFMAELDGSQKISDAVNAMWPPIGAALRHNGALVAIPVGMYGYAPGYNPMAMEKLGLTEEDMPTSWEGFFDFIDRLPALLEGNTEVRAFESWYDRESLRMTLFGDIISGYQNYLNLGEAQYAFNTPMLRGLLERLNSIDFEALDVPERVYDEETDTWYDNWDGREALFTDNVSVLLNSYTGEAPMLLTFADEAPQAAVRLRAAFINPFTKHLDHAVGFLETMVDDLTLDTQYVFYPDRTEPMRYPDFEEYKANLAQWLEDAKKSRDEAPEDEKEGYDEYIASLENDLANIDDTYWRFSPKGIEAYQARAQYLAPLTYDFTNDIQDEESNFYDMMRQYFDGAITLEEMLGGIDKKVQMMRLEGN